MRKSKSFFGFGSLVIFFLVSNVSAWETVTHAALVNKALDEIGPSVPASGPALIKYHDINLTINSANAYRAVINYPEYFRAGNIGPDIFPDVVSGQYYLHPDNGIYHKSPSTRTGDSILFEKRNAPSTFRAIDYAMLLMDKAKQTGKDQDLAFATGYLGHCSVDGFSHSWVNEKANGAWDLFAGSGIFGIWTEEVKHMAVEGLVDDHVPPSLFSTNPPDATGATDGNRLNTRAPYDLLDQYFNTKYGGEYLGGALYDYFNLQESILGDVQSSIDKPLKVLEGIGGIGPGSVESILWLMGRIPGFSMFTDAAGEIADLFLSTGNSINPVNMYFNEVRDNIDVLKRESRAYRRNWMVISSATGENIIKADCVGNTDRCLQVNNDQNLDYAGITGSDLTLFKMEIQNLFKLDAGQDYHSLSDNLKRQIKYLGSSFVLKDLPETLIPSIARLAWAEFKQWLLDNDNYIVDFLLYPIATATAEVACAQDGTVCATSCIVNNCAGSIASCIANACDCGYIDPVCWASCALAPVWCPAEAVVGCVGCNTNCAWDLTTCTAANIFNFNSTKKLADAVDDILAPIDQIKKIITDYIMSKVCELAMDMGAPIKDLHRMVAVYRTMEKIQAEGKYGHMNFCFLKEDLQDPAWYQKLSQGSPELAAFLNSIKTGKYQFIGNDLASLPIDVPANCLDLSVTGAFDKDPNFGLILACRALFDEPGPTATKILNEMGNNIPETFDVVYNSIQAIKLTPMNTQADIEQAFTTAGASASMLPWKSGMSSYYSQICSSVPNVYCDAITSLDNPNATNCSTIRDSIEIQKVKDPANPTVAMEWSRRRGVVAWNAYNPEDPTWKPYQNTDFVFGTSDKTIDKLYSKIFRVPVAEPTWMTFDENPPSWTGDNVTLTTDQTTKSQGTGSMHINGCNYMVLKSPKTNTTDFGMISHELSVDLYIPSPTPNPYWVGAVQLYVDIPAANLNNAYVSQKELTGLKLGAWNTLKFTLPDNIYAGLAGDFPNCELRLALNISGCNNGYRFDNMVFTGDVAPRKVFHVRAGRNLTIVGNSLFSFDHSGDWTMSNGTAVVQADPREEGTGATAVNAGGWSAVKSRQFATSELTSITNRLNVCVYIPSPQPNPWWVGSIALVFSCPSKGMYNRWIGQKDLTYCFYKEYNSLVFDLPDDVLAILKSSTTGCTIELDLNVNNGAGTFLLDKMGFVQP